MERTFLGLRHVALNVRDVQKSLQFYSNVLGMKLEWMPVVLKNGAVEFFFRTEISKNDRFIHARLRCQIARRGPAKSLFGKELHRCRQDVLSSLMFHK